MPQGDMPEAAPGQGANPAIQVAQGLEAMAAAAPSPEVKARIESVMAELGDIATMMEGGALPEQQASGASPVGSSQGTPVGPGL
jgi:hypothetical protein